MQQPVGTEEAIRCFTARLFCLMPGHIIDDITNPSVMIILMQTCMTTSHRINITLQTDCLIESFDSHTIIIWNQQTDFSIGSLYEVDISRLMMELDDQTQWVSHGLKYFLRGTPLFSKPSTPLYNLYNGGPGV